MNPNDPTTPDSPDTPWEEAMSRDFDARVRDLHEAPLDFTSVKGKAQKIRRNRRAAVAGGVLGVAAIVTPVAVLASTNDGTSTEPPVVNQSDSTTPTPTQAADPVGPDWLQGRTWHQADGDEVELPEGDYQQAGIWNDQLVTLQAATEVFPSMYVFDADGNPVGDPLQVAGFAISADQTILAYTTADGELITRWQGGQSTLASDVGDSAGGESFGGEPVSVIGTAPCEPESGACLVRINTSTSGCRGIGSSDVPLPVDARMCFDEQLAPTPEQAFRSLISYSDEIKDDGVVCGGVADADGFLWHGCDYEPQAISPDGQYVVGAPSIYDGLGWATISVLDAETGEQTGVFSPEGGFVSSYVGWTPENQFLFSTYDGAQWHLFSMDPADGGTTELASVAGSDVDNPYLPIQH
ncbi:hypothetical protein [Nocardioides humilatus]|uniref:hypothetical protein n=1 Tax=Nocardioides humilatus TaxID=2607660 RepID=UPI00165F56E0|nr:hypothetical protein [Nocardioides humilatus]